MSSEDVNPEESAPFRARGVVFLGARAFYEETVPGGNTALAGALSPALRCFWEQMFMPATTYDAFQIVSVSRTAAQLAGVSHSELVRRNAAWLAERDLQGAYRILFTVLRPSIVATRLPRLALRYFDFGSATAELAAEGLCRAQLRSVPAPMQSWFVAAVEGFVPKALTVAGGQGTRARFVGAADGGRQYGTALVSLSFELTWS